MVAHPLLAHSRDARLIDGDEPVTREVYLAQLRAVARALPGEGPLINLCEGRHAFLLAFGAALLQGRPTLLPPNRSPETVAALAAEWGAGQRVDDDALQALLGEAVEGGGEGVPRVEADRIAAVVFTSGTTGAPQPNYKRWGQLLEGARRAEAGLELPADCGLVATVPPQHMFGLEMSVMLPLATGRRVLPERPFFPGDIAAALARIEGPRVLFTTPLHLRACLREEGIRWPAIHRIVVSTAPLSAELAAEAERRTGSPVIEIYGSSETGAMATRATAHTEEWRCLDGLSLREEEGVVRVGGGHVPEPVTLNDAVELCSPTTFRLLGRGEDLVDVAGKRASLGGLGEILRGIDGVEDGVFLQPSGAEGEAARLIALVVAPGVGEEAIRRELRRWVDPVFLPRPLYKVESLPRNELGKLPRQALQELMDRMGER